MNIDKAIIAAQELFENLDLNLQDVNYQGTPSRFVEVLVDFTSALHTENNVELDEHFNVLFPAHADTKVDYKGMLVQSPIRIYSLCSHHLLPIIYDIAFAYIPKMVEQIFFSNIISIRNRPCCPK